MRSEQLIGTLALALVLGGCATAAGLKFVESPFATERVSVDKGRIILYREADNNFRSATVEIDGLIVGDLSKSSFLVADVPPGEHTVEARLRYTSLGAFSLKLSIAGGETSYIRAGKRPELMLYGIFGPIGAIGPLVDPKGIFQLETVPEAIAVVDLEELRLSE